MVVTIRVSPDTYDLLRKVKERRNAKSFNKLLRELAEKELGEKKRRIIVKKARERMPAQTFVEGKMRGPRSSVRSGRETEKL